MLAASYVVLMQIGMVELQVILWMKLKRVLRMLLIKGGPHSWWLIVLRCRDCTLTRHERKREIHQIKVCILEQRLLISFVSSYFVEILVVQPFRKPMVTGYMPPSFLWRNSDGSFNVHICKNKIYGVVMEQQNLVDALQARKGSGSVEQSSCASWIILSSNKVRLIIMLQ
jgi:hypothetical protein